MKAIDVLIDYSRKYGADPALVNAGGGNTSAKDGDVMYVKCSGTALKDAVPDSFARMDLAALRSILTRKYPDTDREREAAFLCVHSTLHLLGYDHELSPEDDADMRRRQDDIMKILKLTR